MTIFLVSLFVGASVLGLIEWRLRQVGVVPSVQDSLELWSAQRTRVSSLGDRALVLVGASRMQLGMDLDTLQRTGLEPVQLAIDGTAYMPVLEDLASDPDVTGTILVSATASKLLLPEKNDAASEWVIAYNKHYRGLFSPALEARIRSYLSGQSSLYASSIPLDRLPAILSGRVNVTTGFKTFHDRQQDADFSSLKMPEYYIFNVLERFGDRLERVKFKNLSEFNQYMIDVIARMPESYADDFPVRLDHVNGLVDRIQERGGQVIFVRMPTDKLIWEFDNKSYPRDDFWDVFASNTPATTVHFMDYAVLQEQDLPDGSHIDQRDKKRFTGNLVKVLNEAALLSP